MNRLKENNTGIWMLGTDGDAELIGLEGETLESIPLSELTPDELDMLIFTESLYAFGHDDLDIKDALVCDPEDLEGIFLDEKIAKSIQLELALLRIHASQTNAYNSILDKVHPNTRGLISKFRTDNND